MARVLGGGKSRQIFLQQSLRTKDRTEAKRLAPAVLMAFDQTLKRAEALISKDPVLPMRAALSDQEITRLAQGLFIKLLSDDDKMRHGGRKYHAEPARMGQEGSHARRC